MSPTIRPLAEADLPEADRIFRLAFGTFLGLPDPMAFAPGADLVASRWRAGPHIATFGAFDGDRLIGSNIVTRWGSFGFFGPITVLPEAWDRGVAQALLAPTMAQFAAWGCTAAGLFTFPQSSKHLALYQKYDFWPQRLTEVMVRAPAAGAVPPPGFAGDRAALIAGARALTDALYPGLDLTGEIAAVLDLGLGEIVTIADAGRLSGFAICHVDAGSEAGSGAVYAKFALVRPGDAAGFAALLAGCDALANRRGLALVCAGVNLANRQAYRLMLQLGFRLQISGVAMQRGDAEGYLHPEALVLGDWR